MVAGVTGADGAEAGLVPMLLVAVTVNVYAVPFVRPVTVSGEPAPVIVSPPGPEVTVYPVIVEPPFDAGGVKETTACALPATAETEVGASGYVASAVNDCVDVDDVEPYTAVIVNQ